MKVVVANVVVIVVAIVVAVVVLVINNPSFNALIFGAFFCVRELQLDGNFFKVKKN